MRDVIVTLLVVIGCFYTLKRPYVGLMLWSWLSYMNPHRLSYGFAYNMPFAQITALTLFGSILFTKEKRGIPINSITVSWITFLLFMGLTTHLAYFPEEAGYYYERVVKIQIVTFLTMVLITDIQKMRHLIWAIALSIGYFSIKGGVFTIASGGGFTVWGPPESMIEGNNELAVATLMSIPLMAYLFHFQPPGVIKKGLLGGIPLSFVAAIGTQSRGALLACGAVMFFFWMKSERKIVLAFAFVVLVSAILALMPASWFKRMDTIEHYDKDSSAMGRLNAWEYAFNAANDHLFGMGFDSWSLETFLMYAPNPKDVHAAHSIYFSVLGDHGWIGLAMFLFVFWRSWVFLKRIIKTTDTRADLEEVNFLARMLQVSFIAYFIGGAFLSLSYFDLPWHLVSFVVVLNRIVSESPAPITADDTSTARSTDRRTKTTLSPPNA